MSVQVVGGSVLQPGQQESVAKKSKKRKHEDKDKDRSSSKKRKNSDQDEAENLDQDRLEKSPETRRKRKKKPKGSEAATEPLAKGAVTGDDAQLPDAPTLNVSEPTAGEALEDPSSTARRPHANKGSTEYPFGTDFLSSADPTCFYSTRISLHVSIPAVSLSTARNSILSMHLAPLLLTYYAPAKGVVLAFSDPVLSAKPDHGINLPLIAPTDGTLPKHIPQEILSRAADEFGACWVWLTVTFLVFRPGRGDKLHGWTNVTSKGHVGLVSYNIFQSSVGMTRLPENWTWNGPAQDTGRKKGRKGRLRDGTGNWDSQSSPVPEVEASQSTQLIGTHLSDGAGYFVDESGAQISDAFEYRIVDTDVQPAENGRWALSIEGTLLDEEAEQKVLEEERLKYEKLQRRGRSETPGTDVEMSGGLGESRRGSTEADSPD
jgi:DNA-directed RNA polymerase I subunit RPA43